MGPFDVGKGPVAFERQYQAVPQPPAPQLAGFLGNQQVSDTMLKTGAAVMIGACTYAIFKGKKSERKKNAKMLAGAAFLATTALTSRV